MSRPSDTVKVEAVGVGTFDRFTSLVIANDFMAPAEASFEVGDDGSWNELESFVANGTIYKVFVNGFLRLTGRVEIVDIPIDTDGAVIRFTVRTKLADAMYASANPKTKISGVSIKQFLLALYEPLGYAESDFIFDADVSRNLMTGVSRTSGKTPTDLEPLREEQAKVTPPETIYAAADRHLQRHGFMHWDAGDGRIVVGAPNDEQDPIYRLRMLQGANGRENNILSATRTKDWSEVASVLGVFGIGGKGDFQRSSVRSVLEDADLIAKNLYRPVLVIQEAIKSQGLAERAARREVMNRSMRKDSWDITSDGLSHWTGNETIQWAIDNVADITTTVAGGPVGPYLLHRTELRRTADDGDVARVSLVKKGVWRL